MKFSLNICGQIGHKTFTYKTITSIFNKIRYPKSLTFPLLTTSLNGSQIYIVIPMALVEDLPLLYWINTSRTWMVVSWKLQMRLYPVWGSIKNSLLSPLSIDLSIYLTLTLPSPLNFLVSLQNSGKNLVRIRWYMIKKWESKGWQVNWHYFAWVKHLKNIEILILPTIDANNQPVSYQM